MFNIWECMRFALGCALPEAASSEQCWWRGLSVTYLQSFVSLKYYPVRVRLQQLRSPSTVAPTPSRFPFFPLASLQPSRQSSGLFLPAKRICARPQGARSCLAESLLRPPAHSTPSLACPVHWPSHCPVPLSTHARLLPQSGCQTAHPPFKPVRLPQIISSRRFSSLLPHTTQRSPTITHIASNPRLHHRQHLTSSRKTTQHDIRTNKAPAPISTTTHRSAIP